MIQIRKATFADSDFFLKVRNEESVRKASFNSSEIDEETHKLWFIKKLKDEKIDLIVIEKDDFPIGTIRFDKDFESAEVNIALLPEYRGFGFAEEALKLAFLENDYKKIIAQILPDNKKSQKLFFKLGFKPVKYIYEFETKKMTKQKDYFKERVESLKEHNRYWRKKNWKKFYKMKLVKN